MFKNPLFSGLGVMLVGASMVGVAQPVSNDHSAHSMPGMMEMDATKMQAMRESMPMKMMSPTQRQAQVAQRGKDVMPFSLAATTHIFTKMDAGGTQQVVAKVAGDDAQIQLIRHHLKDIQAQFLKGDFSGPTHIHGQAMPGLAELKAAQPGQINIDYRDLKGGAELTYQIADPKLVDALHRWFDAQLSDHGKDAMQGHAHHDGMKMP